MPSCRHLSPACHLLPRDIYNLNTERALCNGIRIASSSFKQTRVDSSVAYQGQIKPVNIWERSSEVYAWAFCLILALPRYSPLSPVLQNWPHSFFYSFLHSNKKSMIIIINWWYFHIFINKFNQAFVIFHQLLSGTGVSYTE